MTPERSAEIDAFLRAAGWGGAERTPIPGDASTRSYERVSHKGRAALVMNQPQRAEAPACPPEASAEERRALGYNAMARLAGADITAFAAVGAYLSALGLSAPQVYAMDARAGLMLIEDLGQGVFALLAASGHAPQPHYEAAIDALVRLHQAPAPSLLPYPGGERAFLSYDGLALETETLLLPDWHGKLVLTDGLSPAAREDYAQLWRETLAPLETRARVLTLRDYHAENLLWLPDRADHARAGVIDFQDALAGHAAYDVISLLEDARRDVELALREAMTARYIAGRAALDRQFDAETWRTEAAILSAQRNAKIAGIFARLWLRDGKPRYLDFLPRVWAYLEDDLRHPALRPLKHWFDAALPAGLRAKAAQDAARR